MLSHRTHDSDKIYSRSVSYEVRVDLGRFMSAPEVISTTNVTEISMTDLAVTSVTRISQCLIMEFAVSIFVPRLPFFVFFVPHEFGVLIEIV